MKSAYMKSAAYMKAAAYMKSAYMKSAYMKAKIHEKGMVASGPTIKPELL
jgi:hypothetical protein